MNHHSCRSNLDSIDNVNAMDNYDFENLIYHAKEDCELPEVGSRLLHQESKVIQPYHE